MVGRRTPYVNGPTRHAGRRVVLWTRLHGPRLFAAGLGLGSLLLGISFTWQSM